MSAAATCWNMLEKECKRLGYNHKEFASQDKLKTVAEKLRLPDVDGLLASLGYGGTTLTAIMSRLVDIYKQEQQKQLQSKKDLSQLLAELKPRTSKAKSSHGILVKGEDGIMVKLARRHLRSSDGLSQRHVQQSGGTEPPYRCDLGCCHG